jgi:hypothetical protein
LNGLGDLSETAQQKLVGRKVRRLSGASGAPVERNLE